MKNLSSGNHFTYLEQISIQNFRPFGENFHLKLPQGPGLTLIVGANGLGKSSLFDALEWNLTGKVERINIKKKGSTQEQFESLARRTNTGNINPSVKLDFSCGLSSFRDNEKNINSPEDNNILKNLIATDWEQLHEPASYLNFTHFLGQSSEQRFLQKDPDKRYAYIEGPSKLRDLRKIQQKISGRSLALDATSLKNKNQAELEKFQEQLQEWTSLCRRREELNNLASAQQALTPEQVIQKCKLIASEMLNFGFPIEIETSASATKFITTLREQLNEALQQLNQKELTLDSLLKDIQPLDKLEQSRNFLSLQISEQDKKLILHKTKKDQLEESLHQEKETLLLEEKKYGVAKQYLEGTQELRDFQAQKSVLQKKNNTLSEEMKKAKKESKDLDLETEKQQTVLAQSELAEKKKFLILEHKKRVEALNEQLIQLKIIEDIKEKKQLIWLAASNEYYSIDSKLEIITIQLRMLQLAKRLAKEELYSIKVNAEGMSVAVASIAQALSDNDIICPVCKDKHPTGALKKLAFTAESFANQQLNSIVEKVTRLSNKINNKEKKLAFLKTKKNDLEGIQQLFNNSNKEFQDKLAELSSAPEFTGLKKNQYNNWLGLQEEKLNKELNLINKTINSIGQKSIIKKDLEVLLKNSDKAINHYKIINQELTKSNTELNNLSDTIKATIRILTLSGNWQSNIENLIINTADNVTAAKSQKKIQQNHIDKASLALESEISKTNTTQKSINTINAESSLINNDIDRINKFWGEAGFVMPVNSSYVHSQLNKNKELNSQFQLFLKQCEFLVKGLSIWDKNNELKTVKNRLSDLQASILNDSKGNVEQQLMQRIQDKEEKLRSIECFRKKRSIVVKQLEQYTKKIQDHTFKPLNAAFNAFNAALLTAQEYKVSLECQFNKSKASANITASDSLGIFKPELYLSEGQMAALNISLLLSASTTYPWSRWRALLLDDPLQNNDVIHAAAFMDVIRNLIQKQSYQIIISTHDLNEAKYILRKCSSAGIETKICHLVAGSSDGVVWE